MQYQCSLDRAELIDLAINRYFANVDAKNLDDVMACFHDNASITIQSAFTVHNGKENIRRMFTGFMNTYKTIIHKDFRCTVDERNGRIAASFVAQNEDHEGNWTTLNNTNFWRIRDDRFQEIHIYMSGENPLT
ncbi:MAG: nuclear transport factor 2 family protein [Rhizobiaceae bacterium]